MLSKIAHLFGLARAGLTLARNGAFAPLDPRGLPPAASLGAEGLATAREARGQARSFGRNTETRSHPHQAWAVSGNPARCRRQGHRNGAFHAAGPVAALFGCRGAKAPCARTSAMRPTRCSAGWVPPIAAASIAQVHKAEIDGRPMAVKILRPSHRPDRGTRFPHVLHRRPSG
jgi:ubiquinone biosynthesis protein